MTMCREAETTSEEIPDVISADRNAGAPANRRSIRVTLLWLAYRLVAGMEATGRMLDKGNRSRKWYVEESSGGRVTDRSGH